MGLPAEQWPIRVLLGNLYEAEGEYAQAGTAFPKAVALARAGTGRRHQGRGPRARFLAGPQIYQVLQHAHGGHPLI
jgi:hypothetical protein